jgi:hypothetical protein
MNKHQEKALALQSKTEAQEQELNLLKSMALNVARPSDPVYAELATYRDSGIVPCLPGHIREALSAPFPDKAITGYKNNANLTTIKAAYQIERLNDVFGVLGWTLEWNFLGYRTMDEYLKKTVSKKVTKRDGTSYTKDEEHYELNEKGERVLIASSEWAQVSARIYIREYDLATPWFMAAWQIDGSGQDLDDALKSAVTSAQSKCMQYLEVGNQIFKGLKSDDKDYKKSNIGRPVSIEDRKRVVAAWIDKFVANPDAQVSTTISEGEKVTGRPQGEQQEAPKNEEVVDGQASTAPPKSFKEEREGQKKAPVNQVADEAKQPEPKLEKQPVPIEILDNPKGAEILAQIEALGHSRTEILESLGLSPQPLTKKTLKEWHKKTYPEMYSAAPPVAKVAETKNPEAAEVPTQPAPPAEPAPIDTELGIDIEEEVTSDIIKGLVDQAINDLISLGDSQNIRDGFKAGWSELQELIKAIKGVTIDDMKAAAEEYKKRIVDHLSTI